MKNKIIMLGLVMVIAFLLSLLPIYPLWVEGREFTQSGESLYHEWQFVSIRGYYESLQYAQTAWLESTKIVDILLAIVNPLVLIFLSWFLMSTLQKMLIRKGNRFLDISGKE